jgi:hypothetical protein
MGANLLGLPLKEGSQRFCFLAATTSSHNGTEICPSQKCVSIMVATDAIEFACGGNTLGGPLLTIRDYFTCKDSVESSTFRELLGVFRCLQDLVHICIGKFVVV